MVEGFPIGGRLVSSARKFRGGVDPPEGVHDFRGAAEFAFHSPSIIQIFWMRKGPKMFDSVQESWTAPSGRMVDVREERLEDVAGRCRLLWRALGHASSAAFAAWLGVGPTRWNNVESTGKLGKDLAFLLQRKIPGMRVEWLWFGDRAMMPDYLLRKIDEAEGGRISTTRSARSPSG